MAPPTTNQTPLPLLGSLLATLATVLLVGMAALAYFLPPLVAYQVAWRQVREMAPRAGTPQIAPDAIQKFSAVLRIAATKPSFMKGALDGLRGKRASNRSEGSQLLSALLVSLYTDGPASAVGTLDQQLASLLNSLSAPVAQEATRDLLPIYERLKDRIQQRTAIDEQRDSTDRAITALFLRCRGLREDLQNTLDLREPIGPATSCAFYDAVIMQNLPTIAAFSEAPTSASQFISTLRSLSPSLNLADPVVEAKIQKRLTALKEVGQTIRNGLATATTKADSLTAERTSLEQQIHADIPTLAGSILALLREESAPPPELFQLNRLAVWLTPTLSRLIPGLHAHGDSPANPLL
jgi:hypothetical protein